MRTLVSQGENGTVEYTAEGVGESRVALFFALVRGMPDERLEELMNTCINDAAAQTNPDIIADLFVLALQTRDCRGGKGERDLFYNIVLKLYNHYPQTVLKVMNSVSEFGYFKDYFRLLDLIANKTEIEYVVFKNALLDIVAKQLRADEALLESGNSSGERISLCAKYAPREGKKYDRPAVEGKPSIYDELRHKLFPADKCSKSRVAYRKLLVKLSKALDVTETKMCAKRYRELNFAKMPSVCINKFRKAFLNETIKLKEDMTDEQEVTGNRYPLDEDRVQCRANLRKVIFEKGLSGKQLYPHEIVTKAGGRGTKMSSLEADLLNVQWTSIRENLLKKLAETAAAAANATGTSATPAGRRVDVGKLVPLVDVSGSMSGIPMEVAIALGILISEINQPAFRDRLITFETDPQWVSLAGLRGITKKVQTARAAPWGGSTDIEKALKLVLRIVEEQRLTPEEVPDLIVLSDMQFNQAVSGEAAMQTQLEQIRQMFHDVGIRLCGQPYPAPRIVFWNLRGDTEGFPATAEAENVQMLSGYSPSLLKFVLEGEPLDEEAAAAAEEEGEGAADGEATVAVVKKKPTPYETLRKVLDDVRYDSVRVVLSESEEGQLKDYHFEPAAAVATAMEVSAGTTSNM